MGLNQVWCILIILAHQWLTINKPVDQFALRTTIIYIFVSMHFLTQQSTAPIEKRWASSYVTIPI